MARREKPNPAKAGLDALFQRTEAPEPPGPDEVPEAEPARPDELARPSIADVPAEGRTLPTGVGLRESELAALDEIADQLGVARNALIRYAVRLFIAEYRAGRLELEVTPPPQQRRNRLKIP